MPFNKLFEPIQLGNVTIKNRISMSAMGTGYHVEDHAFNDKYINYYAARAKGGVGLIFTSCSTVDRDTCGRSDMWQTDVDRPELIPYIKNLVDAVHEYDCKLAVQLVHPGRNAYSANNGGQQPVAPSAIPENDSMEMPRELSTEEVKAIVKKFVEAAGYCFEAGADGVELHGAHGYLIGEFMTTRSNQRTDEYGGSFENRMRFAKEIIEGVKAIMPADRFLSFRINADDDVKGGLCGEEAVQAALYIQSLGVDAINISRGTYTSGTSVEAQCFGEGGRTEMLKPYMGKFHIPVIAANIVKRPAFAEAMLEDGLCDMVSLGRALLADHEWANKAKEGKADQIRYCISCLHCANCFTFDQDVTCAVNPVLSSEDRYMDEMIQKTGDGRKVVVIGGGPGGLEAAALAAKRGFNVTLFEKQRSTGGSISLPRVVTGMEKTGWSIDAFYNRAIAAGALIRTNTEITSPEQLAELNPYAVIVATGGKQVALKLPGIDKPQVVFASDVYKAPEKFTGHKATVIGSGLTGLEVAEVLAANGNEVTIVELDDEIGKSLRGDGYKKNKDFLVAGLASMGTKFYTSCSTQEVTDDGVIAKNIKTGEVMSWPATLVVQALGFKADTSLAEKFEGKFEHVIAIGDCTGVDNVAKATREAYAAVWDL